jgi:hypothetical protein
MTLSIRCCVGPFAWRRRLPPATHPASHVTNGSRALFDPSPWPEQSFRTWSNDLIFRAAGSSMRQLGASNCFPFRPNGVTIRSQGTKAPVKTLEARDRRSPLTTWRMLRIAKGSYCRARCSQEQALAQIAKSGGLRFRPELPAVLARRESCGRGGRQCWRFLTRTRLRYAQPH